MNTRPIPISAAKSVAQDFGYDQVIIIGRTVGDDGVEHMTTYGRNRAHCDAIAAGGRDLQRFMGWAVL